MLDKKNMKLLTIIAEALFKTYQGLVQVVATDISPSDLAEMMRALPGITTVTIASQNTETNSYNLKVKLITQKTGEEAFQSMKATAIERYPMVTSFELDANSLEEK